jgi:hypothetical protein
LTVLNVAIACAAIAALAYAVLRFRHAQHVSYLEFLLAEAQHGGDATNLWDQPCQHCGRRMRGEAQRTYTDIKMLPGGGTRTTTRAFHSCRPKCAAAANAYAERTADR